MRGARSGRQTPLNINYIGLKIRKKYSFPFPIKFVTWFFVITIVISSCFILMKYGMTVRMIKTYLWVTAIVSSFVFGVFVTAPVRILLLSSISSLIREKKPVVISKKIARSLLPNPRNPLKKQEVLKIRQYNARLYSPVPLCKLKSRLEDIKYNAELRNLTVEILTQIFFTTTVAYVVYINETHGGYYNTEAVKDLFLRGEYTKTLPFTDVITYETFWKYINETFLPALLSQPEEVENETDSNEKNFLNKGWTQNPAMKLLGKPRLRQVRVKAGSCNQILDLKGRNEECAAELTPFNVDTESYTLLWQPGPPEGLTPAQEAPWLYRSAWESRSLPVFGKFSNYPGGGYVTDLPRDLEDAKAMLDFLEKFQWVDTRTRAVFFEFTLYCVNTNLFTIISLIAERSATGCIIPNYQIDTCRFIFTEKELEAIFLVFSILFASHIFIFLLKEGLRMHKAAVLSYMKRGFTCVDVVVIFLGFSIFILIFFRTYYVSRIMKKLKEPDNAEFVSFIYAAFWHNFSIFIEALLLGLSTFKLVRLLAFKTFFFQVKTTLAYSYAYFFNIIIELVALLTAFASLFYLAFSNYTFGFSSFDVSFTTMLSRAVGLDGHMEFSVFYDSLMYLAAIFLILFVWAVIFLYVRVFTAVICLFFRIINDVPLINKYNISEFIKYALTANKQNDILQLETEKAFRHETDPKVMRLKGGGKKLEEKCKCKKIKKVQKAKCKTGITLENFVTDKPYDTTEYKNLLPEREIALKYLVLSMLSEENATKKCERQIALRALFCSLLSYKKLGYVPISAPGPYCLAWKECETKVYDLRRILCMKKVLEKKARKEGWMEEEEEDLESLKNVEEKLSALDEKLGLLIRLLQCRCRRR